MFWPLTTSTVSEMPIHTEPVRRKLGRICGVLEKNVTKENASILLSLVPYRSHLFPSKGMGPLLTYLDKLCSVDIKTFLHANLFINEDPLILVWMLRNLSLQHWHNSIARHFWEMRKHKEYGAILDLISRFSTMSSYISDQTLLTQIATENEQWLGNGAKIRQFTRAINTYKTRIESLDGLGVRLLRHSRNFNVQDWNSCSKQALHYISCLEAFVGLQNAVGVCARHHDAHLLDLLFRMHNAFLSVNRAHSFDGFVSECDETYSRLLYISCECIITLSTKEDLFTKSISNRRTAAFIMVCTLYFLAVYSLGLATTLEWYTRRRIAGAISMCSSVLVSDSLLGCMSSVWHEMPWMVSNYLQGLKHRMLKWELEDERSVEDIEVHFLMIFSLFQTKPIMLNSDGSLSECSDMLQRLLETVPYAEEIRSSSPQEVKSAFQSILNTDILHVYLVIWLLFLKWIEDEHRTSCREAMVSYLERFDFTLLVKLLLILTSHRDSTQAVEFFSHTTGMRKYFTPDISLGELSSFVLYRFAKVLPLSLRSWYTDLPSHIQSYLRSTIRSVCSPILITQELSHVRSQLLDTSHALENTTIRVSTEAVVVIFEADGQKVEIRFEYPEIYPLQPLKATVMNMDTHRVLVGVRREVLRKWLLRISVALVSKSMSLWDIIELWTSNLRKHFDGVEPCPICYAVVHSESRTLPELSCKVCTHSMFHRRCLIDWFQKSTLRTCPTCRSPWGSKV